MYMCVSIHISNYASAFYFLLNSTDINECQDPTLHNCTKNSVCYNIVHMSLSQINFFPNNFQSKQTRSGVLLKNDFYLNKSLIDPT